MADFSWAPDAVIDLLVYKNGKLHVGCTVEGCTSLRQTAGRSAVLNKLSSENRDSILYCALHGGKSMKYTKEQIASWPEGHKECRSCRRILPFESFHRHNRALFGYNTVCKECREPQSKKNYSKTSQESRLFYSAKSRAKSKGLEFDLSLEDIQIPEICEVLGIRIGEGNWATNASIDRIDSNRGYTKNNIRIISRRANILKNNMTLQEGLLIVEDLRRYSS